MSKRYYEWEPVFPLKPEGTALLIIDMQKGFVDRGYPLEVPMAREQVPNISRLADFCRAHGIPVVYAKFCYKPGFCYDFYWKMASQRGLKSDTHQNDFAPGTDETEITAGLTPKPGDTVFEKYGYDCFGHSDLKKILDSLGVKTILITGTVINWCVDSTIRSAFHQDYQVAVMADCVSACDQAGATAEQWYNLELDHFAEAFARVLPSEEAMEELFPA